MKRRDFVQHSFVVGTGLAISPQLLAHPRRPKGLRKITILHTNDTHSNIDVFPESHAKFPNRGGVARRHQLIQQIRREEQHVLLFDAGDIFQGTPYFNRYNGTLEMKLMSIMEYDCATMGNHDFDIGMEGFLTAKQFAKFPFLCSNYDFSDTILHDQTEPYHVFEKGDIRVGVFGLGVELEGLVMKVNYGETRYLDPVQQANKWASFLKNEANCDIVVCLSHLGYHYKERKISDIGLASLTHNIDLIIGGHTHTFLEKPSVSRNSEGKSVLVNQVGWAGLALGRIDFFLDERKRNKPYQLMMV